MSIKWKTTILFIGSFCLNILLLWLFFIYNYGGNLEMTMLESRENFMEETKQLAEMVDGKSYKEALVIIDEFESEDSKRKVLLEKLPSSSINNTWLPPTQNGFGFFDNLMVEIDGENYVLIINDQRATLKSGSRVTVSEMVSSLLLFECFILCIIFILQRYVFNMIIVKPLIEIKENVDDFKQGKLSFNTPKKKDEIGELEHSFLEMAISLNKEKEIQSRMIASISHDIKTPLTVIMGFSERLLSSSLDENKKEAYLKAIHLQSDNIHKIVLDFDELLEQSIDSNLELKNVSIPYLCQMIEDEYKEYLNDKNVGFTIENQVKEEIMLAVDIFKIRRVFMNIIGNALRHNQIDGLMIMINVHRDDNFVHFDFINNGNKVDDSDLENLFEPFYTSDKSRQLSGLGLSICKLFIEKHQGRIKAKNVEDGFKIEIELPIKEEN